MARPSMAALIARVRTLINDSGTPPTFTDDTIQEALDVWRTERRWVALRPQPTFTAGGLTLYLDYYSDAVNWEADAVLQDLSYATITASLAELVIGHWQFSSQPNGIGVRATGKTYDVYASAADLLDAWAARVMLDFDFVTGRDQFHRSQKMAALTALGARYRTLAQPHSSRLVQTDALPQNDGGGVVYPNVSGDGSLPSPY